MRARGGAFDRLSVAAPFEVERAQEDEHAYFALRLMRCGQRLYNSGRPIGAAIAAEVAAMTDNRARLELSDPSSSCASVDCCGSAAITFPVVWAQVVYGKLHVRVFPSLRGKPGLSLDIAQQLAHLCGWLLRTLEDAAFLARKRNKISKESCQRLLSLTRRQREVLNLMVSGHSAAQIAGILTLSKRTVEKHQRDIYCRLNVATQEDATLIGLLRLA